MGELLLDTTYLLPVFGISVGLEDFVPRFGKLLDSFSARYNPASLIEAKWTVMKLGRNEPAKRDALLGAYRTGLKVLASDGRLKATPVTSEAVEVVADDLLLKHGVKDYFDRVIYGTAAERSCVLLTEDEELLKLKRGGRPSPSEVLEWNQTPSAIARERRRESAFGSNPKLRPFNDKNET